LLHKAKIPVAPYLVEWLQVLALVALLVAHVLLASMPVLLVLRLHLKRLKDLAQLAKTPRQAVSVLH
jgi:EamA domain-containing membrane protein RarD